MRTTTSPRLTSRRRVTSAPHGVRKPMLLVLGWCLACQPPPSGQTAHGRGQSAGGAAGLGAQEIGISAQEPGYAVITGIDQYTPGSGFPTLKHAVADAQELSYVLGRLGYKFNLIPPQEADGETILSAIEDAGGFTDAADRILFFFFSGHGLARAARNYLAPYDAGFEDLDVTGIAVGDLLAAIDATPAPRKIVVLDICRESSPGNSAQPCVEESFGSAETAVFLSTRPEGISYELDSEDSGLGHGMFAHYLLDALKGNAEDARGRLLLERVAAYVSRNVEERSKKLETPQRPQLISRLPGDLVLALSDSDPWPKPRSNPTQETAGEHITKLLDKAWQSGSLKEFQELCIRRAGSSRERFNSCQKALWNWALSQEELWIDPRAPSRKLLTREDIDQFYNLSEKLDPQAALKRKVIFAMLSAWCQKGRSTPAITEKPNAISCARKLPTLSELGIVELEDSLSHIKVINGDYDGCNSSSPPCPR